MQKFIILIAALDSLLKFYHLLQGLLLGKLYTHMMQADSWIPITSLHYLTGNFTVYDVVTSASFALSQPSANNYITGVGVTNIVKTT